MVIFSILRLIFQMAVGRLAGDFPPDIRHIRNAMMEKSATEADFYCGCSPYLPNPGPTGPWPGHTYKIRDPKTERQITLVNGELKLEKDMGEQGGYHWLCIETDGYLGFRNPSNNVHIGHNNWGQFVAREYHHWAWEFFNTRAHPDGGQLLLTVHGNSMRKMAVEKGTYRLVETKGDGTAWEFVEVPT
ncbi:hypothetical protein F4815DRAFT_471500 [Daldinia loculata]|nr:hypothetical protein F4815DRAFT_471500 [Daldinia loculata]